MCKLKIEKSVEKMTTNSILYLYFIGCYNPPILKPEEFHKSLVEEAKSHKGVNASVLLEKMEGMEPKFTRCKYQVIHP